MALSSNSVYEVERFFISEFSQHSIAYTGRNQHGADEVYINGVTSLQTRDIEKIVACSKKIGNTVSIIPQTKECFMICFW